MAGRVRWLSLDELVLILEALELLREEFFVLRLKEAGMEISEESDEEVDEGELTMVGEEGEDVGKISIEIGLTRARLKEGRLISGVWGVVG